MMRPMNRTTTGPVQRHRHPSRMPVQTLALHASTALIPKFTVASLLDQPLWTARARAAGFRVESYVAHEPRQAQLVPMQCAVERLFAGHHLPRGAQRRGSVLQPLSNAVSSGGPPSDDSGQCRSRACATARNVHRRLRSSARRAGPLDQPRSLCHLDPVPTEGVE